MANRRVVVLGAGSSGEHFVGAPRRHDDDVEITIVEHELAAPDPDLPGPEVCAAP